MRMRISSWIVIEEQGYTDIEAISDLGSGLNFKKKGLIRLIKLILTGSIAKIIITTKDRLLRFGFELIQSECTFYNIEIICLDAVSEKPKMEQLAEDLVEIITVFSSKIYGARSRKNLKAVNA